ncbi:MAG: PRC-barrel domain-containing protein [Alphaproteobacteria bacterium]|nr:PRC-barrel domain-containing protein [Alphaproteobacteria bacterium]
MEFSVNDLASVTTGTLIAADKVNGTDVYNFQGERIGEIDGIMIDKITGNAIYALLSCGGFLGFGGRHHPLPWAVLKYDTDKEGYVVNMDKKKLEGAPNYDINLKFEWTPETGRKIDGYFEVPSYWN